MPLMAICSVLIAVCHFLVMFFSSIHSFHLASQHYGHCRESYPLRYYFQIFQATAFFRLSKIILFVLLTGLIAIFNMV